MGITHHSNYIRWMEEARVDLLVQLGWNLEKLESMGLFIPVVALSIQYKRPTAFPDRITIHVSLTELRGVRMALEYKMYHEDGALVCTARSEHCLLNKDGRIVRIQKECPEFWTVLQNTLEG